MLDKAALGLRDANAVPMLVPISKTLARFFIMFFAIFFHIFTPLLPKVLKESPNFSGCIVLLLTNIDFFLSHNEHRPTSNLISLPVF